MRFSPPHVIALGALMLAMQPALSHHSAAQFDLNKTLSLSATVTKFEWANPHVYIQLETREDAGSPTRWMIEAGPPNLMARTGWSAKSLTVGETITVVVHPLRAGSRKIALGNSITKQDGTILPMRQTALPAELSTPTGTTLIQAADVFSRWMPVWDPEMAGRFLAPDRGWSLTEAGRTAVESYVLAENPSKDCNFEKPPFVMIWPSVIEIESEGDIVRLRFELVPDRIVHMNQATHEGAQYTPGGHSIGHFEGKTLVVDTTRFEPHRRGLGRGLPSSREKHLTERFELDPGRTQLIYHFTVEDPVYLIEPMSGTLRWQHRPDLARESVACDKAIASRYVHYE